jgi:nucleoid DNA-binding protein
MKPDKLDAQMPTLAKKDSRGSASSPLVWKRRAKSKRTLAAKSHHGTVTLKDLAANLSAFHEMSKKQTEAVLGDLVGLMTKHLKKGDRIRIAGLGILARKPATGEPRAARMGRKAATGEPIQFTPSDKRVADVTLIEPKKAAPSIPAHELTAYKAAEGAYEPSARALALLRGKEICESDLRASGGSFTLANVERLLRISRQAIDKKVREDALLAVPGPHRRRRYPAVQFIGDEILPGLEVVLKNLPSANGWFRLNFLIRPDDRLGGRRPIDLLKEGKIDSVVVAAKAIGVQGA